MPARPGSEGEPDMVAGTEGEGVMGALSWK